MAKVVKRKPPQGRFSKRQQLLIVMVIAVVIVAALVAVEFQPAKKNKQNGDNDKNKDRPPASGDWIVSKAITLEGESVIVNGNLTITATGRLTLQNSTVNLTCGDGRSYKAMAGGELHVLRSKMTTTGSACEFSIEKGAVLEMRDSWTSVGWSLFSDSAAVSKSTFSGKFAGLIVHSSNNNLDGNTVMGSNMPVHASAFLVLNGTKNTISNNKISGFGRGITFQNASSNTVTNNSITTDNSISTGTGIEFSRSNDNTMTYNDITGCDYGVSLMNSTNNLFHHNNFKDNVKQVQDDGTNRFDDGKDGNYWSNYIGFDLNKDGKGDLPYVITLTDWDNRPFMKPVP